MWKQAKQFMFILADSKLLGDKHNLNKIIKKIITSFIIKMLLTVYGTECMVITSSYN